MSRDAEQNMTQAAGNETEDESAPPSKAALARMIFLLKLKRMMSFFILGFAPVVAVAALVVALFAVNASQSVQPRLNQEAAKHDGLAASLLAAKGEVAKLKADMALEKSMQEEVSKKQDEQLAQIVRGVSRLQQKMKISPTLEQQLNQPLSSVVAPAGSAAVPAPAATVAAAETERKPGERMSALKDAIDRFNHK